jgi:hypoxanthine phosphoribosyltransferase
MNLPPDLLRVLATQEQIQARVSELARQINQDYQHVPRLHVVGILKGAFIFMADLTRQLSIPHIVDFMAVSSYGVSTHSGAVRILMDLREPVEDQHVLIVEDILDTGNTIHYLMHTLRGREPASLKVCVLTKKASSTAPFQADYLGFEIPDVWAVGYGLDCGEKYRTLPFIAEIQPKT